MSTPIRLPAMKRPPLLFAALLVCLLFLTSQRPAAAASDAPALRVLASTYPVWLLTRAAADGVPGIEIRLLVDAAAGCPHDYAPTPADLLRIEQADLVVINGLGLEAAFHDALARRGTDVLDCGAGLGEALAAYADKFPAVRCQSGHGHTHAPGSADGAINPHIFAGPRLAALMVRSIAGELARRDPAHAAGYTQNADRFDAGMHNLEQRLRRLSPGEERPRVLLQHDALVYLAADADFDILGIVQETSSAAPSASRLMEILADVRQEKPRLLLGEQQFTDRTMRMLAQESGIPLLCLDTLASGPEDVPADQYLRVMQNNVSLLEECLAHSSSL